MALVTASTIPTINRASDNRASDRGNPVADLSRTQGVSVPAQDAVAAIVGGAAPPHTGSISRRMMLIAAGWIFILLTLGGMALDRALTNLVSNQFDEQLEIALNAMVSSAEIDPFGEVYFNRALGDRATLNHSAAFTGRFRARVFRHFHPAHCGIATSKSAMRLMRPSRPFTIQPNSPMNRCA